MDSWGFFIKRLRRSYRKVRSIVHFIRLRLRADTRRGMPQKIRDRLQRLVTNDTVILFGLWVALCLKCV
ncbi:hypothetical protein I7I50_10164 [Histoplasma capsulatum G186AR]|uniref:Uncharacterized protein n=1 Tax=Ajellomyces capsulatus TaxID=5037 RepID=A0A8H8D732_AJECA|nr:hypothetical protein I7I52_01404 [Histoplasma capsulatum]QSS69006.1 hypothetical protein I7I50_10164 [Histoplasma capsulatum G186AR]